MSLSLATDLPVEVPSAPEAHAYETPAIEAVVTLDELEREVHYAGSPSLVNGQ